jgi:BNR repeat-like domain
MTTARERSGFLTGAVIAILLVGLIGVWVTRPATDPGPIAKAGIPATAADTEPDGDTNEERDEQAEGVDQRIEAWKEAKLAGRAGQAGKRAYLQGAAAPTTTGWAGEIPIDTTADDWEPAIAADPHGPYVYLLTTRYGTDKPCPGNCPTPFIALAVSTDNGVTWSEGRPLCACKGSGQFDPIIEVVPNNGNVYSLFMIGFNVWFTKSTDHGATWSPAVKTFGNVSWNDKPIIAMSNDGKDVYASFNGPTGGDPWVASSHDAGVTWSQVKLLDTGRYDYTFDGDVDADGNVYFAISSLLYSSAGKHSALVGADEEHIAISRDKGATWADVIVATSQPGLNCTAVGCTTDFYQGHSVVSADATGALVYLYDGATVYGGKQNIYASRSTDHGAHWTTPAVISTVGEESTMPMIESTGSGDVRVAFMQTSGGGNVDAWNTWYRRSTDGGSTFSAPLRISDATSGAPYKSAAGYAEVYGDYGEMAITNTGKTIATWGEGISYTGPGGVWVNRER